ncbi:hypothetical protein [Aestuariicoccus sp. MJ-SS9]|uniref:hypothetical protein n=1 Tax=Aestuariicoccus sp. MJ-SS9 TaxID=3079855 RepID=UPI00290CEC75|nr:hypothetical protein [Aestuariicoccus sp. MJ-SS9]MDU8911056.1 hypothetical protein [Aestuariicoccus sp. MJ-SS9]
MSRVAVQGRDAAAEAYRIETDSGRALVPECLMEGLRPGDRPSHQEAYEWIAAHRVALARAVETLRAGRAPKPPYDILTLLDDAPSPSSIPKYPGEREGPAPRSARQTHARRQEAPPCR